MGLGRHVFFCIDTYLYSAFYMIGAMNNNRVESNLVYSKKKKMSVDVSDHNKDVPTYGDVADVRVSWENCTLSTRCSSVVKKIPPIIAERQRTNHPTSKQKRRSGGFL